MLGYGSPGQQQNNQNEKKFQDGNSEMENISVVAELRNEWEWKKRYNYEKEKWEIPVMSLAH